MVLSVFLEIALSSGIGNAFLDLPPPPVRALYEAGVNLCLGTDSRATNEDLSVWAELRTARNLAPRIPPRALVEMSTVNGSRALGFADYCLTMECE